MRLHSLSPRTIGLLLLLAVLPAAGAEWTVGVYMCADNGLNDQSYMDLAEMMEIGSTDEVNIIVQLDNAARDTHPECRRLKVVKDGVESLGELGEVDMADTATLRGFASFLKSRFPARRYFLVLWDHGNGWTDEFRDARTLFIDESHNSTMSVAAGELRAAIEACRSALGRNLEVLGFDACLMGMVEVACEVSEACDYLLGSEGLVPVTGWPYDEVLAPLVARPTATPDEFLPQACGAYLDEYPGEDVCLSALDMRQLDRVLPVAAAVLADSIDPGDPRLADARGTVQTFSSNPARPPCQADDHVDFIHLWELGPGNGTGTLRSMLLPLVVANRTGGEVASARGMATWFPDNYLAFKAAAGTYAGLTFADSVPWLQFLNAYFGMDDVRPTRPAVSGHRLGGRGDVSLWWNACADLAPVSYDLFEAESVAGVFSDYGDDLANWSSIGWTTDERHYRSPGKAFFSGSGSNLENELVIVDGFDLPQGGLLSFFAYYSTEERLDSVGSIERDVCHVEWSHGPPGWDWHPLDAMYGDGLEWGERRYVLPASEDLRLRFRYVTDEGQNDLGVFVDDIAVYRFGAMRELARDLADTTFYLFNLPQGGYSYFLTASDSFGNVSMASQFYTDVEVEAYAEPWTRPAPFSGSCELWLDFPDGLRPDVYIHTVSGILVRRFEGVDDNVIEWDGLNQAGKPLAAGLYLVVVRGEDFRKVGKIARAGP